MKSSKKVFLLFFTILFAAAPAAWARSQARDASPRAADHKQGKENVLVGRISLVEGELLRYVPEEKDWVVAVKDAPFGLEDALYSGEGGKAEFLLPNSIWLRIGSNTQVQMIALKPDAAEIDVAVGTARFIDKSSKTVVKATTPFGYVVAEPGSAFDLYVGDESVEVIGIRGNIQFIHDVDGARYEVLAGSLSILADARQATAGEGKVDGEWDDWNASRDTMWSQSLEVKGESAQYLPEGIREDSRILDESGRWEQVYYEGEYRRAWRPVSVEAGWAPYTVGRWTEYYGDYCWIPGEPFGYVTHHYGNWFWANDYWYWAPPVVSVSVGAPWWGVGFSWYPGRVGWMYSDVSIGWFPLLPWEPFYAHHWWGPRSFAVTNVALVNINLSRYRFANHAFVVNHNNFFATNNLSRVRAANINRATLTTQFRGTAVPTRTALGGAGGRERFNFTNAQPTGRPSQSALGRVERNQARITQASGVSGRGIRQQASKARLARPSGGGSISTPSSTSRVSGTGTGAASGQARSLNQNPRSVQSGASRMSTAPGKRSSGGTAVQGARRGAGSRSGVSTQARVKRGGTQSRSGTSLSRSRASTSSGERARVQSRGSSARGGGQMSRSGSRAYGVQSQRGSGQLRSGESRSRGSYSGGRQAGMQRSQQMRAPRQSPQMQRSPGMQRAPQAQRAPQVQRAPQAQGGGGHNRQGQQGGR
ncbi:MAG: DUF6600 domain-containing protein [Syntrophobacter sp.]